MDKFVRVVEQPIRRTPECEVYESPLLAVVQRRIGFGFGERRTVLLIYPEIQRILRDHTEHRVITEYAGLAEHASRCDPAQRGQLLTQKVGIFLARDHADILEVSVCTFKRMPLRRCRR
ncbi:hypothetical protein [Bradyrhizobium sp. UFLA05-153]